METMCPQCGFVKPNIGPVSDPSFKPDEGFTYVEHTCPTCETVLLVVKTPVEAEPEKTAEQSAHEFIFGSGPAVSDEQLAKDVLG